MGPSLMERARAAVGGAIGGVDEPLGGVSVAVLEPALDRHVAELRARFGRLLMAWALGMNLLWWPTDLLLVSRLPHGLAGMAGARLSILCATVATLLLLRGQRALEGRRLRVVFLVWMTACLLVGYSMGVHRSLAEPWFHELEPLLIATFVVPVRLRARVPGLFLIAASLLAGFLLHDPASLRSAYLPTTAGYLLFTAGVGIAFGHAFFLLIRSNLHHRLALEKNAAELAAHREHLRDEVRARTEELHLLSQHLERAREEEGRRIARELHDELGQGVSALRLAMSATRRRYARNPAVIESNLADLEELIGRVADGTRAAIAHLRPQLLDELGLRAAAEWLAQSAEKHGGIPCTLRIESDGAQEQRPAPGDPADDRRVAVHSAAFRVLQESLANVLRHAQARRADVVLRLLSDTVELEVSDDGVGPPPAGERRGGMGLLGMRERAYSLGGEFRMGPAPGGGTRVQCSLPLAPGGRT